MGLALALVVLLAMFILIGGGGVLWVLPMILTLVGAVLVMRPSAQDWFHPGGEAVTQSGEQSDVLFYEQGASWWWVASGPASAIAMLLIQMSAGLGFQWLVPTVFFVLVTSFVALQVKAARIHTSVELTPTTLREGTERIHIDDIVRIYPEPGQRGSRSGCPRERSASSPGCRKGRTGIGVKLTNDRTAQAWARKHRQLRAQLVHLVDERIPPEPKA